MSGEEEEEEEELGSQEDSADFSAYEEEVPDDVTDILYNVVGIFTSLAEDIGQGILAHESLWRLTLRYTVRLLVRLRCAPCSRCSVFFSAACVSVGPTDGARWLDHAS